MQTNQTGDELPVLLTIRELAAILKISQRSIWRLVASGQLIKPLHVGGSNRWRQDELIAWIDSGCPDVTPTRNQGDGVCSP
jgi:predicted DNA-binding transcriptional regulator AlpA